MAALVIGHKNPDTDSIISALAGADLYTKRGIEALPAAQGTPTPETDFILNKFGVTPPMVIENVEDNDIYLVDFSDLAQAPSGIGEATIKGIVDHHKLGNVTTTTPLEAWIWPVGCTCTVLKNMYDFYEIEIARPLAGAMLGAILSDTVIFKSPTCTEIDRKAAESLALMANIKDVKEFGIEMFKIKSAVAGTPARDLVFRDYKDFEMNGHKVGIGQLEVVDLSMLDEIKENLAEEIGKIKKEGNRHSVFLLLTDIMKEGSEMLLISDEPEIVEKAFEVKCDGPSVWLPGVMSRKKQVVPNFEKAFKK